MQSLQLPILILVKILDDQLGRFEEKLLINYHKNIQKALRLVINAFFLTIAHKYEFLKEIEILKA